MRGASGGANARHQADPGEPRRGGARPRDARRRGLARAGARRGRGAAPAGDRGRGAQGRAQPRLGGHRPGQAAWGGRAGGDGAHARGVRPHQGARRAREGGRRPPREPAARDPERAPAQRPGGRLGGGQRRGAALGHAPAVRVRAEAALRDRRGARHPRLRPGEQDREGAVHRDVGRRVPPQPGPRPVHAGSPHPRARLHRGLGAAPREPGDHDRGGDAAQVRGADVQDASSRTPGARSS